MGVEIERKFLVHGLEFLDEVEALSTPMRQGYLTPKGAGVAVRVRLEGDRAVLTVKGPGGAGGMTRAEFEYEVPWEDALGMLELCGGGLVEKTRHALEVDGLEWVVDVFEGENAGLALAEVELEAEDQEVTLPGWLGEEVTGDARYYNSSLSRTPWSSW